MEIIVKLNLFEKTVSPPPKEILYLFCSSLSALLILDKLNLEKLFLLPDRRNKIVFWLEHLCK